MSDLLRFFHLAGRLKDTPRAGWALRGVERPESVADHSWRTALLALVLARRADPPLDRERAVALALAHDLAEALVGDITPYDGISADEKRRREREAMARLADRAAMASCSRCGRSTMWSHATRATTRCPSPRRTRVSTPTPAPPPPRPPRVPASSLAPRLCVSV
ncbi:MAG: HD domain-containing protein [Longimicrobiaceae bacterium]